MSKKYGITFQKDVLKLILEDLNFYILVKPFLSPAFFNKSISKIYTFIVKFSADYNSFPDKTVFYNHFKNDKIELQLCKDILREKPLKREYLKKELQKFFKRITFVNTFNQAAEKYNESKIDESSEILTKGMRKMMDINFNSDRYEFLFKGFDKRLLYRDLGRNIDNDYCIPTGIRKLDRAMNGGLRNGEFGLLIGDTKGGKSTGLRHFGLQAVKRFFPVLHIQLEDTRQKTLDLYDATLLHMNYHDLKNNKIDEKIKLQVLRETRKRTKKDLVIYANQDWDATSVIDVENIWDDLYYNHNVFCSLILIDYLELLKPRKLFNDEILNQTQIARDLKTISMKKNCAIWAGVQTNRQVLDDDPHFYITGKNVAGDYGKVRVADISISINSTTMEKDKNIARIFVCPGRVVKGSFIFKINQDLNNGLFYVKQ